LFRKGSQTSLKGTIHHPKNNTAMPEEDDSKIIMKYLSREVNDIFVSIFGRYEKLKKSTHEKEFEELNLKKTLQELKTKLILYKNNHKIFDV